MCLDTTFLIALLRGDSRSIKTLKSLENSGEKICTTAICAYELLKGAMTSSKKEKNTRVVQELLQTIEPLPFDSSAAIIAAQIYSNLAASGQIVRGLDVLIAAICLNSNDALVTSDKGFSRIIGLKTRGF